MIPWAGCGGRIDKLLIMGWTSVGKAQQAQCSTVPTRANRSCEQALRGYHDRVVAAGGTLHIQCWI